MGKIGAINQLKSVARRVRVSAVGMFRLRGDNTFSPRWCLVFSAVTLNFLFVDRRKNLVGTSLVYLRKNFDEAYERHKYPRSSFSRIRRRGCNGFRSRGVATNRLIELQITGVGDTSALCTEKGIYMWINAVRKVDYRTDLHGVFVR